MGASRELGVRVPKGGIENLTWMRKGTLSMDTRLAFSSASGVEGKETSEGMEIANLGA